MISWSLVRYVLTAALRDRLILTMALLMVVGASLSLFLGSGAVIEAGYFAVVFTASTLRLAGILGLVLFIVFYLRRAFDTKDVEYMLSRPVSRASYLLSHAAAFSFLALVIALCVFLTVMAIAPNLVQEGYYLWGFSLLIEYIIIVNATLFFAMVLPNASTSALAVLALYVLARVMGQLLGIIASGLDASMFEIVTKTMNVIALIVPRLDLMAQSSWLIYGPSTVDYGFILIQGVTYTALVLTAALVDLMRRQF